MKYNSTLYPCVNSDDYMPYMKYFDLIDDINHCMNALLIGERA